MKLNYLLKNNKDIKPHIVKLESIEEQELYICFIKSLFRKEESKPFTMKPNDKYLYGFSSHAKGTYFSAFNNEKRIIDCYFNNIISNILLFNSLEELINYNETKSKLKKYNIDIISID